MADQKRVGAFVQSNIWNVMDGETRPDKARTVILKVVVLRLQINQVFILFISVCITPETPFSTQLPLGAAMELHYLCKH